MKLFDFVEAMCNLGLGSEEIRIIRNDEYIFEGVFEEVPGWLYAQQAENVVVGGVSMMPTSMPGRAYNTLITI